MAEASSSETWGQDFVAEVFRTRAASGCRAKNKFKGRYYEILGAAEWKKLKYVSFFLYPFRFSFLDMVSIFFRVFFNFVFLVLFLL